MNLQMSKTINQSRVLFFRPLNSRYLYKKAHTCGKKESNSLGYSRVYYPNFCCSYYSLISISLFLDLTLKN